MAVQQGYGKMAGTDALVFAYDTGDVVNSYKGAPTSNLLETDPNWSYMGATITDPNNYPVPLPLNVKFYTGGSNGGISWTDACRNYVDSYPAGTKVTVSGWHMVYTTDTSLAINGRLRLGWHYNKDGVSTYGGTIYTVSEWNKWTYFSHTFSSTGVTTNLRVEDGGYDYYLTAEDAAKTSQYYCNLQIEIGNSFASPYVKGTRSATEGLLDLTGTTSIDLSNVSFDSDAMFQFDGTDDRIFAGNPSELSLSNGIGSIEAVVKFPRSWTGGSQYPNLICKGARAGWDTPGWALFGFRDWPNANNKSWGLGLRNASGSVRTVANYDIPTDVYLHLLATMDGTTMKLYENGILVSTNTQTVIPAENAVNVFIGGDDGSNRFPGDIPVVKVYDKALTDSEVLSNFNNYRNRFSDLSNYYDNSSDGGRWIRWWWYTGVGWPGHETEALGHPFGTFDSSSHYGFQKLPEGLDKEQVELLAKDGDGNIYKWDFASPSATAQQVWDSFTLGTQGRWNNAGDAWNPEVIAGSFFNTDQDAWQYRDSEGVVSFMLDDDTCDCKSTLNAGHAMCGAGWNQTYAQPDGAYLRYGVDTLNDGGCRGPVPERILELFYRLK